MREQLSDWKVWVFAAFVAVMIVAAFRVSVDLLTGQSDKIEKEHIAFEDRLTRLELSKSPATQKRYTSDDAARDKAELLMRIEALERKK